jgi:alpha-ribazole phosphatase/probable phosphoglycerate mutase
MTRTRIYLVRHGQVEGHEQKRYNGQGDIPLTAEGQAQFGLLQLRLKKKKLSAGYSSDLSRCLDGARLLLAPHEQEPIARPDLRELNIGKWQGKTWRDLQEEYPEEWQARLDDIVHYQVPGGESLLDMAERVRQAMGEIVAAHPGEEVLVVGHGGVNRVILLDVIGAPLDRLFHIEQDFGCLNVIDYYPDGVSVVALLNG